MTASSRRRCRRLSCHGARVQLARRGATSLGRGSTPSGALRGCHRQPRAVHKYWASLRRRSCGRLREHAAQVPAVHADRQGSASDSVHRQSVGHPCYATETGSHSANCAEDARFHSAVLTRPLLCNDRCMVQPVLKLWMFRSCSTEKVVDFPVVQDIDKVWTSL